MSLSYGCLHLSDSACKTTTKGAEEMTTYPSRRKIIWFLIKTLFNFHSRSTRIGKCDFSYNITGREGNYQYLSYKEGNNYKELQKEQNK